MMPHTAGDLLVRWQNWFGKRSFAVWNIAPLPLVWILWRENNRQTFEGVDVLDPQLKISFFFFLLGNKSFIDKKSTVKCVYNSKHTALESSIS